MRKCKTCKKQLSKKTQQFYCSNRCQKEYTYFSFVIKWKKGVAPVTKNISKHIKRYFIETYGEKCSLCGWNKRHTVTRKVPLEIDHIDGKSNNNQESNLRLICPNCHSLTPHFRRLNKNSDRNWRNETISF